MDEFGFIEKYLRPLAGQGALGLIDDAAQLGAAMVSKDLLVEGVHFRADDPLALVARKALRVNVSDLVAKGCRPRSYLLGLVLPADYGEQELAEIAAGLAQDQDVYGLSLLGGDTTRGKAGAPLVLSVTMIGDMPVAGAVLRSGASPGDRVFVTGTIGDAGLGLRRLSEDGTASGPLVDAYRVPGPPADLTEAIAQFASASLDVSDGLVADAEHLAKASGVCVRIDADKVPLSGDAQIATKEETGLRFVLTCGDDYQTLFAVPPSGIAPIQEKAAAAGVRVTEIGEVCAGTGVTVTSDRFGQLTFSQSGFRHF